jgi:DMSO reductase anchor subunit
MPELLQAILDYLEDFLLWGRAMNQARKAALAREWIILALSFGLGGHVALGFVLHSPSPERWQAMGWNAVFFGVFVYVTVQASRSIYLAIRSHRAKRNV